MPRLAPVIKAIFFSITSTGPGHGSRLWLRWLDPGLNLPVNWGQVIDGALYRPEPIVAKAKASGFFAEPFRTEDFARVHVKENDVKASDFLRLDEAIHHEDQTETLVVLELVMADHGGDVGFGDIAWVTISSREPSLWSICVDFAPPFAVVTASRSVRTDLAMDSSFGNISLMKSSFQVESMPGKICSGWRKSPVPIILTLE